LYACVVIQPLDHGTNRVIVKAKPVLEEQIGHTEPKIVSDRNLPTMARQLALHSNVCICVMFCLMCYQNLWVIRGFNNFFFFFLEWFPQLASLIFQSTSASQSPYASNWLERLRKIKQLRSRLEPECGGAGGGSGSASESSEFPNTSPKQKQPFHVVDFTEFV